MPGKERGNGPVELPEQSAADLDEVTPFDDADGPPYGVRYRRGDDVVDEEFDRVRVGFGNGRAQLVYDDGRHVTVSADDIREVR